MSQKVRSKVPEKIFVVIADSDVRIYTSEGQALKWFGEQADKSKHPKMICYVPESKTTEQK